MSSRWRASAPLCCDRGTQDAVTSSYCSQTLRRREQTGICSVCAKDTFHDSLLSLQTAFYKYCKFCCCAAPKRSTGSCTYFLSSSRLARQQHCPGRVFFMQAPGQLPTAVAASSVPPIGIRSCATPHQAYVEAPPENRETPPPKPSRAVQKKRAGAAPPGV